MDDWVVSVGGVAEMLQHLRHIGGSENIRETVHNPHQARVNINSGNVVEELA